MDHILQGIKKNGVIRNFAVLGGEPLNPKNQFLTAMVVQSVRQAYSGIQIWVWSGYNMQQIINYAATHPHLALILRNVDTIVTGPFVQEKRDITLPYRGSSNQEVWTLDREKNLWYNLTAEKNYGRTIPNVRTRDDE
jgi:anaerobic ribonucleoside-triphosphate reductase activating protein